MVIQMRDVPIQPLMQVPTKRQPQERALQVVLPDEIDLSTIETDTAKGTASAGFQQTDNYKCMHCMRLC